MILPFLDRNEELGRLLGALSSREGAFLVLYGRRRCGKSRLLLEAIRGRSAVYYIGDERDGRLQRRSLAESIARLAPGFADVEYPGWEALLVRWAREAPDGGILAIDEFPFLTKTSPELPSLLQKMVDGTRSRRLFLVLCGSSQRMMQGLCLDASAPLYGRAKEIIEVGPLDPIWIHKALPQRSGRELLEAYAVWGGVPRYWELAGDSKSTSDAVRRHVLDPLGVLRDEPSRLLVDDLQEIGQASSILSLIGEGCHRLSEIAGRIGKPATSLSRPLSRLVDLGLVVREVPFGDPETGSKKSLYRIADPFLRFWFRFVMPRRSLAEARNWRVLARELRGFLPGHLGELWEQIARESVARLEIAGSRWRPASRWWGPTVDHRQEEIDIVAVSEDRARILVGEAKLRIGVRDWPRVLSDIRSKAERFPLVGGHEVVPCIWYVEGPRPPAGVAAVNARRVFFGGTP